MKFVGLSFWQRQVMADQLQVLRICCCCRVPSAPFSSHLACPIQNKYHSSRLTNASGVVVLVAAAAALPPAGAALAAGRQL
jgi:hypothetical protein